MKNVPAEQMGAVSAQAAHAARQRCRRAPAPVENVVKHFASEPVFGHATVHAVDGVDLAIKTGETLASSENQGAASQPWAGDRAAAAATSGHVFFEDVDLTKLRARSCAASQRMQISSRTLRVTEPRAWCRGHHRRAAAKLRHRPGSHREKRVQ